MREWTKLRLFSEIIYFEYTAVKVLIVGKVKTAKVCSGAAISVKVGLDWSSGLTRLLFCSTVRRPGVLLALSSVLDLPEGLSLCEQLFRVSSEVE